MNTEIVLSKLNWIDKLLEQFSTMMLAMIIVEVIIDLFASKQRNFKETAANFGVGIVNEVLGRFLATSFIIAGLSLFSPLSIFRIPVNIWTVLLGILLTDFLYYWNHVAEHRIRLFWAHHSIHHSSNEFNLSVALRLSWTEDFILWIFYIPMVIIGFHPFLVVLSIQVIGLYQVWIHTEKIGKLGILEEFLNTPSLHRVHHGANPNYVDKNYGAILCIWDKLFGTYEAEKEKIVYGLTENLTTYNLIKINFTEYLKIGTDIKRAQNFTQVLESLFGSATRKP